MFLNSRSQKKELIDLGPNYYSCDEYNQCQTLLFRINKWLGIFKNTVNTLKQFPKNSTVIDVGCGAGLFILNLSSIFPNMHFSGLDISEDAISLANEHSNQFKQNNVSFCKVSPSNMLTKKANIIISTLCCHHLTDEEIIQFFKNAIDSVTHAVIIHDLHRHRIPYLFYRIFSPIFFRNRLINQDGALSILRSFKKRDWLDFIKRAGIQQYEIKWCFPFRWRIILWKT